MPLSRKAKSSAYVLIGLANILVLSFGVEFFLAIVSPKEKISLRQSHTFDTQFLHPYYFFSFPSSHSALQKINSSAEWIDARGYKGDGPEEKGNRKLAFLTGGSTAFSIGTPNSESIAAHLNRSQKEYFFVTAGVPSWNSFQELLRILKQILNEKPKLIVSLNGANDFFVGMQNGQSALAYPLDAPESFGDLEAKVEDIRGDRIGPAGLLDFMAADAFYRHFLLVDLRALIFGNAPKPHRQFGFDPRPELSPQEIARGTAKTYLENLSLIHEICATRGVQHLALFQPVQFSDPEFRKTERSFDFERLWPYFETYREAVFAARPSYLKDLSHPKPLFEAGKRSIYFSDNLHFRPAGNELMAKLILEHISQPK